MANKYSANFLATEFGLDRATVKRVLDQGGIAPDGKQRGFPVYTTQTFSDALALHRSKNASNANDNGAGTGAGGNDASNLTQARVRIANASAAAKERQNKVADGELMPIADIVNEFGICLGILHSNLLILPGKISDALTPHSPFDRGEIMRIVQRETYQHMDEVRRDFIEMCTKRGGLEPIPRDIDGEPIPINDQGLEQ
jgi:phage terminase Nu1 subunit (DNA packaging protein)